MSCSFSAAEGGQKEIDITDPYSIRFISNHYVSKPIKPIKNLMDVGITTIVMPELLAADISLSNKNSKSRFTIRGYFTFSVL